MTDSGLATIVDGAAHNDTAAPPIDAAHVLPDAADSQASDAGAPDIGASDANVDTGPPPLCPTIPHGLSVWLHDGRAYDDALHVAPLTLRGAPSITPATGGGSAWQLAGGEDALSYGSSSTVVDDTLHLTVEGWVNPSNPSANARIVDRSIPNQPDTGFGFDILTTGVLRMFYGPFTAPFHSVQTPASTVLAGAWQHLASTIEVKAGGAAGDTVIMTLYINGAVQPLEWNVANGPTPGQFADARPIPQGTTPVFFGGSTQANASLGLTGQLGDIALWNRTLTATEIQTIATGGPLVRCGL